MKRKDWRWRSLNIIERKLNKRKREHLNLGILLNLIDRQAREEKEREVQRLRDLQEKSNDRYAEIDALRAKRSYEESEKNNREIERREAEAKVIKKFYIKAKR